MNKKISVFVLALALVMACCKNTPKSIDKVGDDKDQHGCIASAGYTWSELKKSCVRIFEAGTQFSAYGKNQDSTLAAYIIISDDRKKAEVFVPSNYSKEPIILDAVKNATNTNGTTLFENKQKKVKIDLSKNKYLIVLNEEPVFSQNYSKEDGLGKLIK
jgi:hypothetical protein